MKMGERSSTGSYLTYTSEAPTAVPGVDYYKSSAKSDSFSFGMVPIHEEHLVVSPETTSITCQPSNG